MIVKYKVNKAIFDEAQEITAVWTYFRDNQVEVKQLNFNFF